MTRFYTVREADRALPYVRHIVREVRARYGAIREQGHEHNALPREAADERRRLKERIREEARRLQECVDELSGIGVSLKDYETGLVDFPARFEGRAIELCWKDGEKAVRFWHERWAGYPGRQPVPPGDRDWPAAPRPDRSAAPRGPAGPATDRPRS